ncbi:MAG: cytochrome P450 [Byssovorax sp.]
MLARTDLPPIPVRGPKAPPLLGPLAGVLRFFADPVGRMLAMHREHGDLAAVVDRNAALVCAFGVEHNRAVISQTAVFEHLSEVPIPIKPGTALARLNNTILFMNGERHRTRRRLLTPAFSKAAVEGYAPGMVKVASTMVERWPIGETADVAPLLRDLTASIALECLFGLDPQDDTEELGKIVVEVLSVIASPMVMLLPHEIPGTPFHRGMRLSERIEQRMQRLVEDKRRRPGGTDALARLIDARDEEGASLTDAELVAEGNSLFGAGFDTSSHTLTWTMLLLAEHPAILDGVQAELREVLGDEPPSYAQIPALVKLDRVIKESMRLFPVAILLFMRAVAADAQLGSVTLPKGAQVILSPIVTHRDPTLYPSPLRFDPDRWIGLDPPLHGYLPFGVGSRMCIGASFATVALRLALARILQRVRPVVPEGARVDYAVRGPAMGPKGGLRLTLLPAGSPGRKTRPRGNVNALVDLR